MHLIVNIGGWIVGLRRWPPILMDWVGILTLSRLNKYFFKWYFCLVYQASSQLEYTTTEHSDSCGICYIVQLYISTSRALPCIASPQKDCDWELKYTTSIPYNIISILCLRVQCAEREDRSCNITCLVYSWYSRNRQPCCKAVARWPAECD